MNTEKLTDNSLEVTSKKHPVLEFVQFALTVLILFFVIRMFIGQPFIVDGSSMSPNFETGHFILVDKLTYHVSPPNRGDVIVFRFTHAPEQESQTNSGLMKIFTPNTYFIKRVIGLPGEKVAVRNGVVYITHKDGAETALDDSFITKKKIEDIAQTTLANDEYYVIGDNRAQSYDSRYWGPVKKNEIEGRAILRILPLGDFGILPASLHSFGIMSLEKERSQQQI